MQPSLYIKGDELYCFSKRADYKWKLTPDMLFAANFNCSKRSAGCKSSIAVKARLIDFNQSEAYVNSNFVVSGLTKHSKACIKRSTDKNGQWNVSWSTIFAQRRKFTIKKEHFRHEFPLTHARRKRQECAQFCPYEYRELGNIKTQHAAWKLSRRLLKESQQVAKITGYEEVPTNLRYLAHSSTRFYLDPAEFGSEFFEENPSFATPHDINALENISSLHFDGTHDITKNSVWSQLYTICAIVKKDADNSMAVVRMYVLLKRKDRNTYVRMLNALKSLSPLTGLRHIYSDFESAFTSACKEVFPDCSQHCCGFHQQMAVRKKSTTLGLKKLFESQLGRNLRSILMSLPFLPCACSSFRCDLLTTIRDEIDKLRRSDAFKHLSGKLEEFYVYLEKTWLGVSPRFHPISWASECFDNYINGRSDKTNNVSETLNRTINAGMESREGF